MYHLFQSSNMPFFKIWNEDESKKKLIKASTTEELLQKAMFQKWTYFYIFPKLFGQPIVLPVKGF